MFWLGFVSVSYVLFCSALLKHGQSVPVISIGTVSVSGSEESLLKSLEEHEHRIEKMTKNLYSVFELAISRSIARGQDEYFKGLKTIDYNTSVDLDRVSEKFTNNSLNKQELEENLSSLILNLTSMIEKADERIYLVNEKLTFVYQSISSTLQTVNNTLGEKVKGMQEQFSSFMNGSAVGALGESGQKLQTTNETLSSAVGKINERFNSNLYSVTKQVNESFQDYYCRNASVVCDCSDIKANGFTTNGVYRIYVVDQGQRYYANASCDMTTANDAWTVFQRRKDGSVEFYREWNDYENGFGNPNGEYWLGNNVLHLLTSKRRYRLRIDLEDFEGEKRYAEYSTFNISSSADKYRLRIGTYSRDSDAGDSLSYHDGHPFSTKDNDNDADFRNCAVQRHGAWWYKHCSVSNLNGLYLRGNYSSNASLNGLEGVRWGHWHHEWYSLKTTEMKITSY